MPPKKKKKTWMSYFNFTIRSEHPRAHLWDLPPKNATFCKVKKTITKKVV